MHKKKQHFVGSVWIDEAAGRKSMKEILIMLAIVGIWILLQAYILPKLGVST